jgi:hypothetical protein
MKKSVIYAALLMLGSSASAQDAIEAETPDVRRYTVEMIIFKYAQDVSVGSEVFVADPPPSTDPLNLDTALDFTEIADIGDQAEAVLQRERTNGNVTAARANSLLVPLLEDDLTLTEIYRRMQRLEVYEPLMHFGWTQVTVPLENTAAMPLASFAPPPSGLAGDLTLYLSRYLHLSVDLQLDAPGAVPRNKRRDMFGDEIRAPAPDQTIRYRINENRIVRNGELRYFDHPKFGVLAKVTRIEDEENASAQSELVELLGDIPQ